MSALPIFNRAGVFYWRRRIPRAIAAIIQRTHFCRSLRTANRRNARLRALRLSLAFEETMQKQEQKIRAGRVPTKEELDRVLLDLYDRIMTECEEWAATRPRYLGARTYENIDAYEEDMEVQEDHFNSPAHRERLWMHTMEEGDYDEAAGYLPELLAARDLTLDQRSVEFKKLAWNGMKIGRAAFRRFQHNLSPDGIDAEVDELITARSNGANSMKAPGVDVAHPAAEPQKPRPMFSEAFEQFRKAMSGSEWQDEQNLDSATALKLWLDLEGDCQVDKMADKVWDFRGKLDRVPRLHGRSVFKGLTAAQATERADAIERGAYDPKGSSILRRGDKVDRLSKKTQNKHLTFFTSFWNWKPMKELGLGNPFGGTLHKRRVVNREQKLTRQYLTDAEVGAIFRSPVWAGCTSNALRTKPGKAIIRDTLFWVPLLAAFQGLRVKEALQLWCEDIDEKVSDIGLTCIWIRRGDGRRLKSDAAVRELPLHPVLRDLGFLDYVAERQKEGQTRVFPDYVNTRTGLARRDAFSKAFGRYRREVGCGGAWKDLHAFRHSVDTILMRKGFQETLIAYVLGHEGGYLRPRPPHMTTKVYFGGYEPAQVEQAISAIEYQGLRDALRHLIAPTPTSNVIVFPGQGDQ